MSPRPATAERGTSGGLQGSRLPRYHDTDFEPADTIPGWPAPLVQPAASPEPRTSSETMACYGEIDTNSPGFRWDIVLIWMTSAGLVVLCGVLVWKALS